MNKAHLQFCSSPEWASIIQQDILPRALRERELGDDVLEIGSGPGISTDVLRQRTSRLTAVELDEDLAAALAARLEGTNVEVVHADASDLPLPDGRFSAATTFTMLHHVPTAELQDRVLAELHRVLRPGGLLIGSDSVASDDLRAFHEDDVYVPIDPAGLPDRLRTAGFRDVVIEGAEEGVLGRFHFWASA